MVCSNKNGLVWKTPAFHSGLFRFSIILNHLGTRFVWANFATFYGEP